MIKENENSNVTPVITYSQNIIKKDKLQYKNVQYLTASNYIQQAFHQLDKSEVTQSFSDIKANDGNSSQRQYFIKTLIKNNPIEHSNSSCISANISINEDKKYLIDNCLGCKRPNQRNKMANTDNCNHYFCTECFKQLFQSNIENGIKTTKCPINSCKENIPIEIWQNFLTKEYYDYLYSTDNAASLKKSIDTAIFIKSNTTSNFQPIEAYLKKNVIDINSNRMMFVAQGMKKTSCPKCSFRMLFNCKGIKFMVCLNCIAYFCCFCFCEYTEEHFIKNIESHCKVYFRHNERLKRARINQVCKFILIHILLIIASYIIFIGGIYRYIAQFWQWLFCSYNTITIVTTAHYSKCKRFIYYISYIFIIISSLIILPMILLGIPYFPMLSIINI